MNRVRIFVGLPFALAAGMAATDIMAAAETVPEPFRGHNPDSKFTIQYEDVNTVLKVMVVDVGRSSREKAPEIQATVGTRMKTQVNRQTATEANRFWFEEFDNNEDFRQALRQVRLALEAIPGRMPLEHFNRDEQLAYWLNLYNITVLDELVQLYPERNLKKEIIGKKSILEPKILNVSGIDLSLNDIQHTILAGNYNNDPVILYGLHQGYIGSPNIRRSAYTGDKVYQQLQDNAEEFINSNRGTHAQNGTFEVSSLYQRNAHYFPNFDTDLKQHLMRFIEGDERAALQAASTLKPDIDDWNIVDVHGTMRDMGGSFATSQAAMIDSVENVQYSAGGKATPTNFSVAYSSVVAQGEPLSNVSPEILDYLVEIKEKQDAAILLREGRVTIEELGEVPAPANQKE